MTALANNEPLNAQASEDNAHAAPIDPVSLPELVSPAQIDELLGYKIGKAKRLANRGELPHYKLPDGSIRFSIVEISEVIAACKQGSALDPRSDFDSYLTAADVAIRLNVKVHQIIAWTASGTIPRVQIEHTTRYNWAEVEVALAAHAGFKTTRHHRRVNILTLAQAASKLEMTSSALRRLAEAGDVPSYRNGTGKGARLFFSFDSLWAGIVKLQGELTFQEFNCRLSGKAASK